MEIAQNLIFSPKRSFFLLAPMGCGRLSPIMRAGSAEPFDSLGKICLGAFLALALILAALLSASPSLHEQLHADASAAAHLCVVTLFASGHCQSATPAPVCIAPATVSAFALPSLPAPLFSASRQFSILEHAPPPFA